MQAGCGGLDTSSFVVTVMYRPRLHGCRVAGAKRPHDLLHNIRYTLGMKFTDGRGNRPFLGSLKPSFGGELARDDGVQRSDGDA